MTRDDIIRLAQECGFGRILMETENIPRTWVGEDLHRLERFAALVAAAERQACAELVEPSAEHRREPHNDLGAEEGLEMLDNIAAAIRARGQQ